MVILLAVAVSVAGGVVLGLMANRAPPYTPALALEGNEVAPDFRLIDQNGETYHLREAKGKVILLYFGYTNCPDVCPIVMAKYAQLAEALGSGSSRVDLVFIGTDTERDTLQAVRSYVNRFSSSITGLTGSKEEIDAVLAAYKVPIEVDAHSPGQQYFVAHLSLVLVADKDQVLRFAFTPEMDVNEYITGVRSLL